MLAAIGDLVHYGGPKGIHRSRTAYLKQVQRRRD